MELFKIFGTIAIKSDEAKKSLKEITSGAEETSGALDDAADQGEKSGGKIDKVFSAIGKGALQAAKIVGTATLTALKAASTAIASIGKQAIESYAEYEQLVGGVDTLFKESSDIVKRNAEEAFKTLGMSANEYMDTVTGFSASLIQSLGGDTKKAAEKANIAITDMADNANKMGTNMQDIQNAYQGFAKQNYTIKLMSAA